MRTVTGSCGMIGVGTVVKDEKEGVVIALNLYHHFGVCESLINSYQASIKPLMPLNPYLNFHALSRSHSIARLRYSTAWKNVANVETA